MLNEKPRSNRVEAIDALRGLLMCVIVFNHALIGLSDDVSTAVRLFIDATVRFGGTPGFCMVSGMLLGYFIITRPDLAQIARSYRRRALHLLFLAHLLIAMALFGPLGRDESFADFFLRRWYITDNLAVFFLLGPWLLPKISPSTRLMIGLAILPLAKLAYIGLAPESVAGRLAYEAMLGSNPMREQVLLASYGLAQTAAYFLIGSFLGHHFANAVRGRDLDVHVARLRLAILPLLGLSVLLVGIWAIWKLDWIGSGNDLIQHALYPTRDGTLYPAYVAIFLAALVVLVHRTWPDGVKSSFERALVIFGKTSLFTYVAHYYIVQTLPWALGWVGRLDLLQMLIYLAVAYPVLLVLAKGYLLVVKDRRPRQPAAALAVAGPGSPLDNGQFTIGFDVDPAEPRPAPHRNDDREDQPRRGESL